MIILFTLLQCKMEIIKDMEKISLVYIICDIKTFIISDGIGRDIKATIDCTVFNKCFDEIPCIHLIQMK